MIEVGKYVRIKSKNISGKVVGHVGSYNTVEYQTQVFGEPNMVHMNRFGCLDEELEEIDGE